MVFGGFFCKGRAISLSRWGVVWGAASAKAMARQARLRQGTYGTGYAATRGNFGGIVLTCRREMDRIAR